MGFFQRFAGAAAKGLHRFSHLAGKGIALVRHAQSAIKDVRARGGPAADLLNKGMHALLNMQVGGKRVGDVASRIGHGLATAESFLGRAPAIEAVLEKLQHAGGGFKEVHQVLRDIGRQSVGGAASAEEEPARLRAFAAA